MNNMLLPLPDSPSLNLTFDMPELFRHLVWISESARDALPFGLIGLDAEGRVCGYNRTESEFSGLSPSRVLERPFFAAIAPCMATPSIAGRFGLGRDLDEYVQHRFPFPGGRRRVTLRLLQRAGVSPRFLAVQPQRLSG